MMRKLNAVISSVHAAAFLIGAASLSSRLLGVFRDRLLAGSFGAGRQLDIYYAAFQIPDFMASVFLLGAGTAAILPIFQEYLARDKEEARRLISSITTLFLVFGGALSLAAFFLAPFIVRMLAPGFSLSEQNATTLLTRIMLLSPMFFGLSSIFSSVVQSFKRFVAYAVAPIFYNIGIIIGIAAFVPFWGFKGLAFGVILGACGHAAVQYFSISHLGFTPRLSFARINGGIARIVKLSFPRMLSLSLVQLTELAVVALGSTLKAGSITVFTLAQNLYFLPVGLFGLSYSVALFPRMNEAYLGRNGDEFFREFFFGIRTILFWIAPATAIFLVLRAHIVRVALGAGVFSWEDTRLTAASLAALVFAMAAGSLIPLFIRAFYALEFTWIPLAVSIGSSAVTVVLAYLVSSFLAGASPAATAILALFRIGELANRGVLGLSLGFAAGLLFDGIFLYLLLMRFARHRLGTTRAFPLAETGKIIVSAIAAGLAAYFVRAEFAATLPLISFLRVFGQGLAAGATGAAAYIGILFLLKSKDLALLGHSMQRRMFRIGILPKSWDNEATF